MCRQLLFPSSLDLHLIRWLSLFSVLFILGVIIKNPWLVLFSVSLTCLVLLSSAWGSHSLDQVTYRRKWRYRRGFPKEKFDVRIEIQNRKILPISWVHIKDPWPLQAGPEDENELAPSYIRDQGILVNLCSLRWHERVQRTHTLLLRKRGVYAVGPAELSSSDIFGLFNQEQIQPKQEYITIFPELLPVNFHLLPTENPFGNQRSQRRLFEDPNIPIGVRPYQPMDDLRRIHWPATARSGNLQVKVYQPVSAQVMIVCLNVSTASQAWMGTDSEMLEQLVKIAATLAYQGVQDGYAVGLISNGCLAHADTSFNIQPGRSKGQLAHLLQALASVTPYISSPFENYLIKTLPKLPYGAILVIVTAVVKQELAETLVRLKRYRSHTSLISLDTLPPPNIPGVRMLHLPEFRPPTE